MCAGGKSGKKALPCRGERLLYHFINNIQPSVSRIFSMAAARLSQPSFK